MADFEWVLRRTVLLGGHFEGQPWLTVHVQGGNSKLPCAFGRWFMAEQRKLVSPKLLSFRTHLRKLEIRSLNAFILDALGAQTRSPY